MHRLVRPIRENGSLSDFFGSQYEWSQDGSERQTLNPCARGDRISGFQSEVRMTLQRNVRNCISKRLAEALHKVADIQDYRDSRPLENVLRVASFSIEILCGDLALSQVLQSVILRQ